MTTAGPAEAGERSGRRQAGVGSLVGRRPEVSPEGLVEQMVPPPRFADVTFDGYVPADDEPSQAAALAASREFVDGLVQPSGGGWLDRLRGRDTRRDDGPSGLYLDGGFGVGKTHLLASTWHAAPGPKAYGTFVELTHLVGALGFAGTVEALGEHRLLCIDEFELDDPGDTVLVSTLLGRLVDEGVAVMATSNTLPGALGEGRFAAEDFLREIQGLSARFRTLRIDGPDYRHRDGLDAAPEPLADDVVRQVCATTPGAALDHAPQLLEHLASLHPSRYGALVADVALLGLLDLGPVPDQAVALRAVVLVDRLYDRQVPVLATGRAVDALFTEEMLAGGYRKKYLRALSRLRALVRDGQALAS